MEDFLTAIKNSIIRVLKSLDPGTDVFFEKIMLTGEGSGLNVPEKYYFIEIIPAGNETVDAYFTDAGIFVNIAYHDESESNTEYLIKSAQLDALFRPVFSFGDRHITINKASAKVVDSVLHFSFSFTFRASREEISSFDLMGELELTDSKGEQA